MTAIIANMALLVNGGDVIIRALPERAAVLLLYPCGGSEDGESALSPVRAFVFLQI